MSSTLTVFTAQKTRTPWIYKSTEFNHVWGLQHMVQSVSPAVFEAYVPLVLKLKPRGHQLNRDPDYAVCTPYIHVHFLI